PNRLLIVAVNVGSNSSTSSTNTVSTIMYGSQSLTKLASARNQWFEEEIWYLPQQPTTGTNTITVTLTGAQYIAAGAVTFYNVNQTTPLVNATTNSGNSWTASVSVP